MELDEQMHNKFTSLKSLFKSTDPSKHFHGNKVKKFSAGKDQPDPSNAQLISKSNLTNTPVSIGFKDKLLKHYRENFAEINEDNSNSTRIYTNPLSAKSSSAGIKLHSKYTNPQILKNTKKFANREKKITKSDSENKADTALMTSINREHERNYEMKHQQHHHPEPVEPRLKSHKLSATLSKFMPKKVHTSSSAMHDPKIIARKQDSFADNRTPTIPAVHIDTTPSHSVSHPTPVHATHPAKPRTNK